MRIRRLELERYGRFTGAVLDFGAAQGADFHIVYGPNEAGKSTARAALMDLFFGMGKTNPYAFLHDYKSLRVSAVLEEDGAARRLTRVKKPSADLLDETGRPDESGFLERALRGLTREAYAAMFCLNAEGLEEGGRDILEAKGELGQALFAASAGLDGLAGLLKTVEDKADDFARMTNRGGSRLKEARERLQELEARREKLDVARDAFAVMKAEAAAAQERARVAADRALAARKEMARLERLSDAAPAFGRVRAARLDLEQRPETPAPTPGALEAARAAATLLGQERLREDEAAAERARLEAALAAPFDGEALALVQAVAEAESLRVKAEEARALEGLRIDLAAAAARTEELRLRLEAPPDAPLPEASRLERLSRLTEEGLKLAEKRRAAEEEAEKSAARLKAAEARRASTPEPPPIQGLSALLRRLQTEAPAAGLRAAAALEEAEGRAAARAVADLAPWKGAQTELLSPPAVAPERVESLRARRHDLERRLMELANRRGDLAARRSSLQARLRAILGPGDTPSDEEAGEARTARDRAWLDHERALSAATAALFKTAMDRHDRIQDLRSAQSVNLAEARRATAELAETEALASGLEDESVRASCEAEAADAEAARLVGALGLPSAHPFEALPEWLRRRQEAGARLGAWREAHEKRRHAQERAKEAKAQLARAVAQAGGQLPTEARLDELTDLAQGLLEANQSAESKAKAVKAEAEDAAERHQDRIDALDRAKARLDDFEGRWRAALDGVWFSGMRPEAAREFLDGLNLLSAERAKTQELDRRVRAMADAKEAFAATVAALCARLSDPPEGDAFARFGALRRRTAAAQAEAKVRGETKAVLEGLAAQAAARALRIAEAKARLEAFGAPYDAHEAAMVLEALAIAEARANAVQSLRREERGLRELLGAASMEEAEEMAEGLNAADLAMRSAAAQEALKLAEAEEKTAFALRGRAEARVAEVGGDDEAARLASEIQTLRLEMAELARGSLRLRLGLLATEEALKRYREERKTGLLDETGRILGLLTCGACAGVEVEDRDRKPTLCVKRSEDGRLVAPEGLSDGARDQLYLGLRLAGQRAFRAERGAVPFIADDVLQRFDESRTGAALRLLAEMGASGQFVYFTHHRFICDLARKSCGDRAQIHHLA